MLPPLLKTEFPVMKISPEEAEHYERVNSTIDSLIEEDRKENIESLKGESIFRLSLLSLPWICDFNCDICFTKGIVEPSNYLNSDQTINFLDQVRGLGARVAVWVGEGEPTISPIFWESVRYLNERKVPSVVFTNGSVFVNDNLSKKATGLKSDLLISEVEKLKNLHLYVKY